MPRHMIVLAILGGLDLLANSLRLLVNESFTAVITQPASGLHDFDPIRWGGGRLTAVFVGQFESRYAVLKELFRN